MPLPSHIPSDTIANLPHTCGIYYFINSRDEIIYIGKSVDIKQRVKSHFYAAANDPKEKKLAAQTHDIKYEVTAGELSALLLESFEIKKELPLYNRRLRRITKQYSWTFVQKNGFYSPKLVEAVWPPVEGQEQFGSFRSMSHAREFLISLCKRHCLCAKILGIESSGRSCFGYQLKQCRGACVGKETAESHNLRLMQALNDLRLEDWPFEGLVGIVENAAPDEVHVFDGWHFLGVFNREFLNACFESKDSLTKNKDLESVLASNSAHILDRDSYKIVLSFLKHKDESINVLDFSIGLTN